MKKLSEFDFEREEFSPELLEQIARENLWNLWVPEAYGGLEMGLPDGLKKLRELATIDGSLGWTVTLCSGANFFIGNLQEQVADEIFKTPCAPVCFGGSGGVFGTAEKSGEGYVLTGTWKYATGAPFLTHFTLNAKIQENGEDVLQEDGSPLIRSFVIKKEEVRVIRDWNTMGLKATATDSFEVPSKWVHAKYSFTYNEVHQPQPIFKVPFALFADLTLWVNYIGMADHFLEEAKETGSPEKKLKPLYETIKRADASTMNLAERIQKKVAAGDPVPEAWTNDIHQEAADSVRSLSQAIMEAFPYLGIRAARENHRLNQVFRDYFTATQHHIFRRPEDR
ncbi:acyl-CoA dehydrogenase family protein [Pseudozobellia thermophila]|uniref:Acyl-CoA dehydrogenase n=1 Tax=Pseudozobellia thermophila TaxID=192903 RepID=A0A1M6MTZ8_9FLAO|nr:acyl-CoA dehydrogenase family protein [Pseudozobellia thermophila]SHJ86988.1 Acyl-CoA dehydrogenase [Pseudozobellia thermophila]